MSEKLTWFCEDVQSATVELQDVVEKILEHLSNEWILVEDLSVFLQSRENLTDLFVRIDEQVEGFCPVRGSLGIE